MSELFLIKFTTSQQCTPDDWEVVWKEKLFTGETTISQIKDWVKLNTSLHEMIEVRLSKPEISTIIEKPLIKKTPIEEWYKNPDVSRSRYMSGRIYNLLFKYPHEEDGIPFKFVEDINRVDFLKLRNAGLNAWSNLNSILKSK